MWFVDMFYVKQNILFSKKKIVPIVHVYDSNEVVKRKKSSIIGGAHKL